MASVSKRKWIYKEIEKEAWILRYVDAKGIQRQETFKLKKQEDAARRKVEDELLDGTHISAGKVSKIAQAAEAFLRFQEDRQKTGAITASRVRNCRIAVDLNIIPHLGKLICSELKSYQVEDLFRTLVRNGLSPRTARDRLFILKQIMDFAVRREWARANPVPEGIKQLGQIRKTPVKTFSLEDVQALLLAADKRRKGGNRRSQRMVRCVVNIAALCGLRFGEIMGLRRDHIRLDARIIEVRHSLNDLDELKGPKTHAGIRDVPMPEKVYDLLTDWIREDYIDNDRQLIFVTAREGTKVKAWRTNFRAVYWLPLLREAGLSSEGSEHLHFHALRHFYASMIIANGVPVMDAAKMLGHSHFDETLQTYAHPILSASRQSAAVQAVANIVQAAAAGNAFARHSHGA